MPKNSQTKVTPVILCGGSGTRLWPISRRDLPKQFSSLLPGHSMFQQALSWVAPKYGFHTPILLANFRHQDLIEQQSQAVKIRKYTTLYEPESRNTAAAVLCAALYAYKNDKHAIMLSLPSDHVLENRAAFCRAMDQAKAMAEQNKLVLFGITPTEPNSAYGYIVTEPQDGQDVEHVRMFEEKPNAVRVQELLDATNAYWNSGMLMFKAKVLIQWMRKLHPDLVMQCTRALKKAKGTSQSLYLDAHAYSNIEEIALDNALLELATDIVCVPAEFRWCDAGSWNAIAELSCHGKEENLSGNVLHGDTIQENCHNTYLRSESRLVAAVGVENLVVIETPDAVLVAERDRVGDIKQLVEQMKRSERDEIQRAKQENRPWGSFTSIDDGKMHQVKHIEVASGAQLSLQRHSYRSEHWVVVEGIATVTICGEVRELKANESVYIPKGAMHRLSNETKQPLRLIEVQYGAYLGEDDIERFDDVYGRSVEHPTITESRQNNSI